MKIAIYAIAKDESKNVDRFIKNCVGADYVLVGVDGKSSDDTLFRLRVAGFHTFALNVVPWRFDVARNIVLNNLPDDIDVCVSIDFDEDITPNWRSVIEREFGKDKDLTLMRYPYVYLWRDDAQTIPSLTTLNFKIHIRHGYVWRNAVHENLVFTPSNKTEKMCVVNDLIVFHHPDMSKERNYNAILDRVVKEEPDNMWMRHIRARELFNHDRFEECIEEAKIYLNGTVPYGEVTVCECRSEMCRLIGKSLHALKCTTGEIQTWMLRAVAENQNQRENWVYLAESWLMYGDRMMALASFNIARKFTNREFSPECEERCWDDVYITNQMRELFKVIKQYPTP